MAESLTLNPGVGGGVIRVLDDGTYLWPAGITAFATSVANPDIVSVVTPTTGLPVRLADGSGYLATLPVSLASVPSHAVTNAGTFAVQAAQSGAWTIDLGATDNAVLDAIAASVAGTLVVGDGGSSLTVDGTVTANAGSGTFAVSAASLPLPSGAATAAAQATGNASLATLAGAVSGTEVQVDVLTMPTVAVTGTFWQATQPVSVASTLTVTGAGGTFPVTDSGGSLTVDNGGTFAVQAAQSGTWNITNVSGTISLPTGAATAAKQPALGTAGTASSDVLTVQGVASMTPLLVNGSGVTQPVSDAGGSLTVDNGGTFAVQSAQSGTWTVDLGATDNAVLDAIAASVAGTLVVGDGGSSLTVDGTVTANAGSGTFAVSAASLPLPSGAATAANQSTANTSLATLAGAVSGTEVQVDVLTMPTVTISDGGGTITVDGTVAVTGTFWQATQPVSVASTLTVTGAGGTFPVTDSGGSLTVDNGGTFAVQAAQSGDWAAIGLSGDPDTATYLHNAGTPYLGGTYSRMIQWVGLRDSSGNEPATATTTPGGSDRGLVVRTAGTVSAAQSGTWNVTNVSGTVSLPTGAATAAKQPALGTAGTASSDVLTVQGVASMTPLLVNGSGVTQPVSGTVTAELSATDNAVLDAIAASLAGTLTVTGGGGGTEYTEGATDASITGSAILWEDTGDTLRAVSAAKPLPIGDAGGSLTVDGTVAATQSGTWTVQPGNTANTTAWLVTGTGGTFPVTDSGGSLTVDAPVGTPVFVRLSDGSSAISTLPVSLASVPSHAVTNAGTFATQVDGAALTALQLIDNPVVVDDAAFTPATTSVMMAGFTFDDVTPGSVNEGDAGAARMSANRCQYVVLRDNAGNERGLNIDASGQLAVTLASSQTLATVTTCSTVTTVSTLTGGGVAHDSADSGNPHKIGAKAVSTPSTATMVANADRTDATADLDGALLVRLNTNYGDLISERVSDTGGTSTAFTNFGATASARNYVTAITVYNSSATAGYVDIRDGTAGSVLYTIPLPAGGGAVLTNGGAPLFRSTANTALAYDVSGALTTVYISMTGFKSKV